MREHGNVRKGARNARALPAEGFARGPARPYLESMIASRASDGDIVAISADPGMCKTQLAFSAAAAASCDEVVYASLSGLEPDLAYERLSRMTRRVSALVRKGKTACLVIDDVCEADECDVARMCRPIVRAHDLGAALIITMRPEAEQLLDGLPGCLRMGKAELMIRLPELEPALGADAIMRASCGVPELAAPLQDHVYERGYDTVILPAYGEALLRIVRESLRESVIEEERIMRFCAYLLGEGTFDEVEAAAGGDAPDGVAFAFENATLIEADHTARTFKCAGVDSDAGLMYCSDLLASCARRWPLYARAAADGLIERGDVARAAHIMFWLDDDNRHALALHHGMELLNAGETDLVRGALASRGFIEDASQYAYGILDSAYRALWSSEGALALEPPSFGFALRRDAIDYERSLMLVQARALLGGSSMPQGPVPLDSADAMTAALAVHMQAVALLCRGRVNECRDLLALYKPDKLGDSLANALLVIDEQTARVLACEEMAPDMEQVSTSEDYFERAGLTPLIGWGGTLLAVHEVLLGIAPTGVLGGVAALAERRGNSVLAAALFIGDAFSELSRRAYVSAHVRVKRAAMLASGANCKLLEDVAAIMHAVCTSLLEDDAAYKPLVRRTWSNEHLDDIASFVCAALSDARKPPLAAPIPNDLFWLVQALANLPEPFSRRFRAALVPSWTRRLEELEKAAQAFEQLDPAEADVPTTASDHGGEGMELCMLGGFSLYVNGMEISGDKLGLRSARTVLAFLAASPSHKMSRVKLIEAIWPDTDLVTGRERIYQSVSRIRRLVHEVDDTLDPIALVRNDGMICLAADVHSDIDDFLAAAHTALASEGSDEETVEAAQTAARVFKGGMFVPLQDASGFVRTRARELRKIYTDVMVLGSEAALRLGRRRQATRFAEAATVGDGGREDVVIASIRALKASGRFDEALTSYRLFAKRMARSRHRKPSPELRAVIAPLLEDEHARHFPEGIGKEA